VAEKIHGINGMIYIGGTLISYANAWSITISKAVAEVAAFGDTWQDRVIGLNDWNGTVGAWHDQDSKVLQNVAIAGTTYPLLIYPKRADLTTYYSGNAVFTEAGSEAGMDSAVGMTCAFAGAGALTPTGFT